MSYPVIAAPSIGWRKRPTEQSSGRPTGRAADKKGRGGAGHGAAKVVDPVNGTQSPRGGLGSPDRVGRRETCLDPPTCPQPPSTQCGHIRAALHSDVMFLPRMTPPSILGPHSFRNTLSFDAGSLRTGTPSERLYPGALIYPPGLIM